MGNTHSAVICRRPDSAKDLLRAAEAGDVQALKTLLRSDARLLLHYSVFGGNSAWHKAAKGGHAAVLEALEAAVQRHYEQDNKDLTEILKPSVLRMGTTAADVVARLVNKSNVKGFTPLMLACSGNHTEVVAWLIKHGADVWKHDRVRRHTALHCAAEVGATDAIRLLLARAGYEQHPGNHRTLLEQGNHAGLTALHYAVYCEQHEVVAQLVAQDADITAQAEFPDLDWGCINAGDTAMHIAAHKGNIDAIQIMLKAYNEKSGAFLPSQDGSRRLRDPRAMRNDYGRLPYHLAMRKGLTWLGEMLDPSVPVRFLLTDEQMDANTQWGPPRLATIAAAVLHRSLVADLKAIQAGQQVKPAAYNTAAPDDSQLLEMQQLAAARPAAATISQALESSSSSSITSSNITAGRRRWGRHRRANSDAARWAGRLSEISPRPSLGSRRLSTGGLGRISRRGRTGSPSTSSPSVLPPNSDRINIQEALGQLSPRALVAALVGSSGDDAAGTSTSAAAAAAALAGAGANASPSGGASWMRLVTRQVRLGSTRQHQHQPQQPMCASPDPDDCCPPQQSQACDEAQDAGAHKASGCSLVRSASDSFCLVLADAEQHDWQKLSEAGVLCLERNKLQGGQEDAKEPDGILAVFDSGKVSPFPELKPDVPEGVLEGLLEQYVAELRGTCTSSPLQAQQCGSISSDEGHTCGVCLDAAPTAMMTPCEHTMCADCALDMCERCPLGTAVCPFCRCIIKSFVPVCPDKPASAPGLTAAKPALAAAPMVLPVC